MLTSMVVTLVIISLTILIHYEVLNGLSRWRHHFRLPAKLRLMLSVLIIFAAHSAHIWLFAGGIYLMHEVLDLGALAGNFDGSVRDYVYFSAATYSTLGYGDIEPHGYLRMVCGFEALIGLLMMAWSAAYTVLHLQPEWHQPAARPPAK